MKKITILATCMALAVGALSAQERQKVTFQNYLDWQSFEEETYTTVDPFGNIVEAVTDPRDPNWRPDEVEPTFSQADLQQLMSDHQVQMETARKAGVKIVRVYLAVDTEYINRHADWFPRAHIIFLSASGAFMRDANIFLTFGGLLPWDSNGDNNSQILSDLASDFSGLPDGLVLGYTRDANFTAGGKAYVYSNDPGLGFSVVYDQSINSTIYAVRHEISHNYGMSHDEDNSVCMMNYDYAYSVDYWDDHHEQQLLDNELRFGAIY